SFAGRRAWASLGKRTNVRKQTPNRVPDRLTAGSKQALHLLPWLVGSSIKTCNHASRFADEQRTGRMVPRQCPPVKRKLMVFEHHAGIVVPCTVATRLQHKITRCAFERCFDGFGQKRFRTMPCPFGMAWVSMATRRESTQAPAPLT